MVYTTNPKMPKLRAQAVEMVRSGKSIHTVAKYFGFQPSTVMRWARKALPGFNDHIPTFSSRPSSHSNKIAPEITKQIVQLRHETNGRCAEVIHQYLLNNHVLVSLSTVKRVLDRNGLINKRNHLKRRHQSVSRPSVIQAGDLVQIDTIHLWENYRPKLYVYTILDVFSRWAFVRAEWKINTHKTIRFVRKAHREAPFQFECLQSDNGPEFSQNFTERIKIIHRHSRVHRPNDNAHLERVNRTIQDEFLSKMPMNVQKINQKLPEYLNYYNSKRLHPGIELKTPIQLT